MESSERSLGEFKRELPTDASTDTFGVYEAWWTANTWYPDRPLSERLAMSELAIRELLAAGPIMLVRNQSDPVHSQIAAEEHDETLRAWATGVIGEGGSLRWSDKLGPPQVTIR
jgi:hypothetical protein